LCPEGAGPNTLRLWESMAVGAIPVVFADEWIPPKIPNSPLTFQDCAITVKRENIDAVFNLIEKMPLRQREALKDNSLIAYAKYRDMRAF